MNTIHNPTNFYGVDYDIIATKKLSPDERAEAVKRFADANPTLDLLSIEVIRFDIDELKLLHD